MSDPELERRVGELLAGRAERLDPQLTGPPLRARADRPARRVGRIAGPALAAAAVIVVALAPHLFTGSGHSRHVPPGGRPTVGTSVIPAQTGSPTRPHPAAPPSARPLVPQRVASTAAGVAPTSSSQAAGASASTGSPSAARTSTPPGG